MPCTKGPGTNGGAGHLEDHERAHTGAPGSQADHGDFWARPEKSRLRFEEKNERGHRIVKGTGRENYWLTHPDSLITLKTKTVQHAKELAKSWPDDGDA